MNEAETRAKPIDPALRDAGWGVVEGSRIGREVIAPGRLVGNGKRAQSEFADYVLVYRGENSLLSKPKSAAPPTSKALDKPKNMLKNSRSGQC